VSCSSAVGGTHSVAARSRPPPAMAGGCWEWSESSTIAYVSRVCDRPAAAHVVLQRCAVLPARYADQAFWRCTAARGPMMCEPSQTSRGLPALLKATCNGRMQCTLSGPHGCMLSAATRSAIADRTNTAMAKAVGRFGSRTGRGTPRSGAHFNQYISLADNGECEGAYDAKLMHGREPVRTAGFEPVEGRGFARLLSIVAASRESPVGTGIAGPEVRPLAAPGDGGGGGGAKG
jgi:hypothetical protein